MFLLSVCIYFVICEKNISLKLIRNLYRYICYTFTLCFAIVLYNQMLFYIFKYKWLLVSVIYFLINFVLHQLMSYVQTSCSYT